MPIFRSLSALDECFGDDALVEVYGELRNLRPTEARFPVRILSGSSTMTSPLLERGELSRVPRPGVF
jgi:hypothetical protein